MKQTPYLTWIAPEHPHKEKRADWYIALGIITVSGIVASVLLSNILLAVIIAVGAGTLALQGSQRPKMVDFVIGDRGVSAGRTLYPWDTLASFWVTDDSVAPAILLVSERAIAPLVMIPIAEHDPAAIRELLSEFLDEEEQKVPFSHRIAEYLGF